MYYAYGGSSDTTKVVLGGNIQPGRIAKLVVMVFNIEVQSTCNTVDHITTYLQRLRRLKFVLIVLAVL